jgi:hypothetical protein
VVQKMMAVYFLYDKYVISTAETPLPKTHSKFNMACQDVG